MIFFDNILVTESNTIIEWSIIIFVVISLIYLTILSIINKDIQYPVEHPYLFTIETLLFSIGSGLIIFLMAYGRSTISITTVYQFIIITLKFGLLSILLQFSGFYSYVFHYKNNSKPKYSKLQ